jgi:hypothetical protein
MFYFPFLFLAAQYPLLKKWGDYLVANAMLLGTGSQCVSSSSFFGHALGLIT